MPELAAVQFARFSAATEARSSTESNLAFPEKTRPEGKPEYLLVRTGSARVQFTKMALNIPKGFI